MNIGSPIPGNVAPVTQLSADGRRRTVMVLEPGRADRDYWLDLWRYRELFAILAWRDFSVRYKQTVIGIAWAVLRPLLTTLIFTVIFGRVAQLPSDGAVPYPLLVFAGMLPWFLFSSILSDAASSMVINAPLVGKVYFPRMIIPGSTIFVALVDFSINLVLFAAMMTWFGQWPTWRLLFLPFFVFFAVAASIGPALLLASLNVKYRDFRFVIPFVMQFGLYISPVGFSSSVVSDQWRWLYSLNPAVGVIDGFRWCMLGGESPLYWPGFLASSVVVVGFMVAGIVYFRKTEKKFADLI